MLRQRPLAIAGPILVLVTALSFIGCGGSQTGTESTGDAGGTSATPSTTTETPAAPAAMDGAGIFKTRCAICHGPTGHGDGPTAKALNPKPRNLSDAAYMSTRPDDSLLAVITNGKGAMPKWGGVLKDEEIKLVLAHVRSLAEAK
jgi:mono/diheme cytochrome c family protein